MEDPESDGSFVDKTSEAYEQIAINPIGMAVSAVGYIYIAQAGLGVVKLKIYEASSPKSVRDFGATSTLKIPITPDSGQISPTQIRMDL